MEWKRGPIIGRGSSATVYLATTAAGDQFAVKSVELSSSEFLQKEQQFLSKLNSPRIITYMGFDVDYDENKPMYNLFMEYAGGGTISDEIKKHGGSLDESLIRSYTHQILLGLDHLHLNNLVHCDIKCQNILVGKDGVKIGDLGCAKLVENSGVRAGAGEISGTPVFMAPEVARGEEQGFPADVWAVGCAVIEMATGSNPWPEVNGPVSALYRIGFSGDLPEFPRRLSPEGKDFLASCLKIDAKDRWTTKELLRHPFIKNSDLDFKEVEEFIRNSPTSVLDQDFWGSLEVPEPSPALTQTVDFSGDSLAERMRQLVEASRSVISCLPNWEDEEDWVTVRCNHIEETVQSLYTDLDYNSESTRSGSTRVESTHVESGLFSNFCVERIGDFGFFMLEYDVLEGSSESVKVVHVSRFLDSENVFFDHYLLMDFEFNDVSIDPNGIICV